MLHTFPHPLNAQTKTAGKSWSYRGKGKENKESNEILHWQTETTAENVGRIKNIVGPLSNLSKSNKTKDKIV